MGLLLIELLSLIWQNKVTIRGGIQVEIFWVCLSTSLKSSSFKLDVTLIGNGSIILRSDYSNIIRDFMLQSLSSDLKTNDANVKQRKRNLIGNLISSQITDFCFSIDFKYLRSSRYD